MTNIKNIPAGNQNICVVGAGLVGTLWAILLQQRGYKVSLFEKRSDIRKVSTSAERSINLIMTSRGLHGLAEAHLLNEAISLSVPIYGRMIHAKNGETQFQPYGNEDECNFSISRSELNKFLLTSAEKTGVKIYFEHELEQVNFQNKTVSFHSAKENFTHSYDILFGTDGSGSAVRKQLCKKFPDTFYENIEWLEADYKELFLPASENGDYKIEKNALHIWPRGSHMMMALANLDSSFTVTIYMPQNNEKNCNINFLDMSSKEKIDQLFKEDFSDAISLMPNYSHDFISRPQGKLGTVRCSKWVYDHSVVLMGDAAHAIVPFFGQGMNCGFEDCVTLIKILESHNGNWEPSFSQFEKVQKPNADAIATMALENWIEMRDKVGDTKFLYRKKVESYIEKKFPKLFKSRYGMVTYTTVPYAIALEIGQIHDKILTKICNETKSVEEISLKDLENLLTDTLASYVHSHHLSFATDSLVATMKKQLN